ncbi:MAG: CRISPR-associated endonuclease Cas1, partial [Actinomycetota bacterium]
LYVSVQGAGTRLRHGHLQVVKDKELLLSVPVSQLGQLVTFGSVGVSAQVREYALRNQIDVVFLSRRGQWLGRLDGPHPTNTRLRRRQYRRADDQEFRLGLARVIVAGKIANLRALLLRYQRRDAAPALVDTARGLEDLRRAALQAPTIPALMGVEGSASRDYFQAIALLLPEEAGFGGRNRRPPRDPANAALSFGYTLLLGEAVAALSVAGLDPHVGFLHAEDQGRPSLALDLVEEFRPLLVDTVVLELFRRRILTSESFRRDQEKAVYLKDGPRRTFLAAFEERLLTRFAHVPSGTRTSYRRGVLLQARQLAGLVLGYADEYRPVSWR